MPKIKQKIFTTQIIKTHANKKGVTIFFDFDENSPESKMDSCYSFEPKGKILTINVAKLSEKDEPLLLELIRKVHSSGQLLLKTTKKELLSSYVAYTSANKDQTTLEFFKDILDKDDYNALKMSLYIRYLTLSGENISQYKIDIRERFGDRGAHIANLCTAGYFEQEFIPLYNKSTKDEFFEYYEVAVGKKALALFIHRGMGEEEISSEFDKMLEKAFKYHIKEFHVHGLGSGNVQAINDFFSHKENPQDRFIFRKGFEKTTTPIAVEYIITVLAE